MKTTLPKATLSRRRMLTTGAAALAFPATAFAQQQPQPSLFPPFPQLQFPRPYDPNPAKPEPQQITEADWFVGTVQDGPFEIRKVNMELLDEVFRRQLVPYSGNEQPGTLVIDPKNHFLYSVRERGEAVRYGVGVGREGFGWAGDATINRKQEWPDWHPPKEMRLRQPELPEKMLGGPKNPLGARALYLYQGNRDTLYRIHGTFEPWTIGTDVSSGCIRLLNEEIADLYLRTPVGTKVVVLGT